jgi:hypothetical protein
MKARLVLVFAAVACFVIASTPNAWAQHIKDRFIGTWKLISFEYRHKDGEVFCPLGANAVGWLTYGADGRMAVQIMKPDRPRFTTSDFLGGTPEEKLSAYEGYIAYLGTYTVNEAAGYVVHHVEGSLFPNWIGTEQKRSFTLNGSRLVLESAPFMARGRETVGHLIWERLD